MNRVCFISGCLLSLRQQSGVHQQLLLQDTYTFVMHYVGHMTCKCGNREF